MINPTHIEHIGIAVDDLEKSIAFYEKVLGLECYGIEEVVDQKVRTAFFKVGQTKIELLEATGPESPIARYIEKRGSGIHHIAFSVQNINNQLKFAENEGIKLIDTKARKGAEKLNIAFLHPKSTGGVLIELCEGESVDENFSGPN
jgi:methylmalonyl-CoA/ethylmalonyl-CoA epimerase